MSAFRRTMRSVRSVRLQADREEDIMRLSRKQFLNVVTSAAAGSAVASAVTTGNVAAAQGAAAPKSKKLEGAAIKGATEAVKRFIATTNLAGIPANAVLQAK